MNKVKQRTKEVIRQKKKRPMSEQRKDKCREYSKAWRERNPGKSYELFKAWKANHIEERRQYKHDYYMTHREEILAKAKERYRKKKAERMNENEKV